MKNLTLTECAFIAGGADEEEILATENNGNAVIDALECLDTDSNNLEMLSDIGE